MPIVIVERDLGPDFDMSAFEGNEGCYEMRRVEHLHSYISPDGARIICVYRAPDAASVREANDMAGQPYDRAWTAGCVDAKGEPVEL